MCNPNLRQDKCDAEVKKFEDSLPSTMADDDKQKEINDFKAKTIANAKQQKAKKSQEAKQAAAKEKEQEKAEHAKPAAKVQVQKSGSAAASSTPRASLAPGALPADQVNREYYEAVQHDQDTILRHLGKQFASEAALPIGNVKDEGGIQALPVLHCRFLIWFCIYMFWNNLCAICPDRSHSAKINARRHCRTMARTLLESMPFGLTTCEAQHLECHYKEIK